MLCSDIYNVHICMYVYCMCIVHICATYIHAIYTYIHVVVQRIVATEDRHDRRETLCLV